MDEDVILFSFTVQFVAVLVQQRPHELDSMVALRDEPSLDYEHFEAHFVKRDGFENVQLCSFGVQAEEVDHSLVDRTEEGVEGHAEQGRGHAVSNQISCFLESV